MRRLALATAGLLMLAGELPAQQRIDPSRLHPVLKPPRFAGTVDVATGRWTRPGTSTPEAGGVQTIFNNTCSWSVSSYFAGFESCEAAYDEGRIPSTSDPNAPVGAEDANAMNSFQVAYCTYAGPQGGVGGYDLEVAFWDNLGGNCVGNVPPSPPQPSTTATAYFDLGGLGLPGSTAVGFQACWIVTFDVSNMGWVMASDGDGTFDNSQAQDKFTWSLRQNTSTSTTGAPTAVPDGFFLAGEPLAAGGYGTCSYTIPCGTDPLFGNTCGTGLDAFDNMWINVDGVAVGSSAGAPPGCPNSVAQYGQGTNCYFFGGYPTNVFSSFWVVLRSQRQGGGATQYCTALNSSCGVPAVASAPSGTAVQSASGTGTFDVSVGPVPGGSSPGILIYTTNGALANPVLLSFGFLCISSPFFRVLPPAVTAAGCASSYSFDFGNFLATQTADPRITAAGLANFGPAQIDLQGWFRDPAVLGQARFSTAVAFNLILGSAPPPPIVSGFTPPAGGQGTVLTVNGSGFGVDPNDLKILLANGVGFADVSVATNTQLSATVFPVGQTGIGPITVVRGTHVTLANRSIMLAGISSSTTLVRSIPLASGTNSAQSFTLSPLSNNTAGSSTGTPLPGAITLDMSSLSGDMLTIQLAFKVGSDFRTFELRIDFNGTPSAVQRAEHLATYINMNFGGQGLSASVSGTTVRATMGGATYGGAVVTGQ